MDYDLMKACAGCPFLKDDGNHPKAVRLRLGRVIEIHNVVTSWHGGQFPCHKTTTHGDEDEDGETQLVDRHKEKHCAGALAYAGKINGDGAQVSKYAVYGMLGKTYEDYGPPEAVFDSLEEFKASSWEAQEAREKAAETGEEPEPYEGEFCNSAEAGCIAPAGFMTSGGIAEGTEYCDTECSECGEPVCEECMDEEGRCIFCAEAEED